MADITITAANVSVDTTAPYEIEKGYNAGTTITAGQAVYLDSSNLWQLSDANGAAALRTVGGIALHASLNGQPLAVAKPPTTLNIGATVAIGTVYVSSGLTAGGIAPSTDLVTGWYTTIIGVATTAGKIPLRIYASGVAVP